MKTWLWYAKLDNGLSEECTGPNGAADLGVGDKVMTQWGEKTVVEIYSIVFDPKETEPFGV